MTLALNRLLRSLAEMGCEPWSIGSGHYMARCPQCRAQGIDSLIEIRAGEHGIAVACISAHESTAPPLRRRPAA